MPIRDDEPRSGHGGGSARAGLPTKDEIVAYLKTTPGGMGKRELMRAFGIKGQDRVEMKRLLAELADDGVIEKGGKRYGEPGASRDEAELPPVALLEAGAPDDDGETPARPANWVKSSPPPSIVLASAKRGGPALGQGDRFLGRLKALPPGQGYAYEASVIKKLGRADKRLLGVLSETEAGWRLSPVDKREGDDYAVDRVDIGGARDGDLVEAAVEPGRRLGLRKARVIDRIGAATAPKAISLIAISEQGIEVDFPPDALREAEAAAPIEALGGREDLRALPLVTIDPEDARDHDDAVCAARDDDPDNPDGWTLWVAIADVAAYVRPGSALDAAARSRGNSAYFPDRVVPMLPERLSADLCSLHEGVDRPCLAARIVIDARGRIRGARFVRGLMRSQASLTYEQAQKAWEGEPDEVAAPLHESVIEPLFGAYHALRRAREGREPLDLDLPERKVILDEGGEVAEIRFRDRFDAHKLIEEFMILANVAAAEALEAKRARLLYRVHEEPNADKVDALREILAGVGVTLAKGQVMTTKLLNAALDRAAETEHFELANMAVLRAQTQAYYAPDNLGHFGLALRSYAHFTSPIRRYADLIVHRALIGALGLPDAKSDGLRDEEIDALQAIGDHISGTERRAMTAERDTVDRYLAAYLADREGAQFEGRIAGVQRFGLFVKLDDSGADGFIPIARIGDEYFAFDEARARLVGERSGVVLAMGQSVRVRLLEATPVTGGLLLELLDLPSGRRPAGGGRAKDRTGVDRKAKGRKAVGRKNNKRVADGQGAPGRRVARGKLAKAKANRKARRRTARDETL